MRYESVRAFLEFVAEVGGRLMVMGACLVALALANVFGYTFNVFVIFFIVLWGTWPILSSLCDALVHRRRGGL